MKKIPSPKEMYEASKKEDLNCVLRSLQKCKGTCSTHMEVNISFPETRAALKKLGYALVYINNSDGGYEAISWEPADLNWKSSW